MLSVSYMWRHYLIMGWCKRTRLLLCCWYTKVVLVFNRRAMVWFVYAALIQFFIRLSEKKRAMTHFPIRLSEKKSAMTHFSIRLSENVTLYLLFQYKRRQLVYIFLTLSLSLTSLWLTKNKYWFTLSQIGTVLSRYGKIDIFEGEYWLLYLLLFFYYYS
jgi:hypothetical protein